MGNITLTRIRRILLTVGLSSAMMANAALPAFAVTSIGNDVTVGNNLTVTTGSSLGIVTAGDLLVAAGRAGLTLTNGDGFFTEPPERAFVRIPFCSLSVADIEEGIARLGQIVRGRHRS